MITFTSNLIVFVVFLAMVSGCATEVGDQVRTTTPVPEDVRANLGTIGLVVSMDDGLLPDNRFGMPGELAPKRSSDGEVLRPTILLLYYWPLIPFVAAAAIGEASNDSGIAETPEIPGMSKAEVRATGAILRPAWSELHKSNLMTASILEAAKGYAGGVHVKPLTEEEAANPEVLKALEINTILKLIISNYNLIQHADYKWIASLHLHTKGYVFRRGETQSTYNRFWEYESKRRAYKTLAKNDAQDLREEVKLAFQKMSEKIANDLFASTAIEVSNKGEDVERGVVRATYSSR